MGIAEILMKRDGMTKEDADDLIEEARESLNERLEAGEMPFNICGEFFGLEPDYIDELIPL